MICMNLGNFDDAARPDISRFVAKIGAPYVVLVHQHYENSWIVPDDSSRQRMMSLFSGAVSRSVRLRAESSGRDLSVGNRSAELLRYS